MSYSCIYCIRQCDKGKTRTRFSSTFQSNTFAPRFLCSSHSMRFISSTGFFEAKMRSLLFRYTISNMLDTSVRVLVRSVCYFCTERNPQTNTKCDGLDETVKQSNQNGKKICFIASVSPSHVLLIFIRSL